MSSGKVDEVVAEEENSTCNLSYFSSHLDLSLSPTTSIRRRDRDHSHHLVCCPSQGFLRFHPRIFSICVYSMSSKVDEVEEEKKRLRGYLNENAVDIKDLASWRKQSEDILLMRLLSPDLARARREMAETRIDKKEDSIVRVKTSHLKDLNRVVDDVRRRNQKLEKSRDVSDKLSLYPGGNLLFLRIDAIAIASASDSKLHQKVVRLGGTGLETEVKSKLCNKKLNHGDVVETKGHNLLAKRVMYCAVPESKPVSIHSVEGVRITEVIPSSNRSTISASTRKALSQCYSRSLDIAVKTGSRTVAFPSLGTGMFGIPSFEAAACAVESVRDWLDTHDSSSIDRIVFVIRDSHLHEAYECLMMECFPFSNKKNNPLLCNLHDTVELPDLGELNNNDDESSVEDLERRLKMLVD